MFSTQTMDRKEAKRIFTLINSPTSLLQDQKAVNEILKFAKNRELGDDRLEANIEIFKKCAIYLKRKEPITENEFHELRELGIPGKERQELKNSLEGDLSHINHLLHEIQDISLNKIVMSHELEEFKEYIFQLAKKENKGFFNKIRTIF